MSGRKSVEKLAKRKGFTLNFRYRYELLDGHNVVYWALFLSDIEKYLNEECVHA